MPIADAAGWCGYTERGLRNVIARGEVALLASGRVALPVLEAFRERKRAEVVATWARRGITEREAAQRMRKRLPESGPPEARWRCWDALLPDDRVAWGKAVVRAAAEPDVPCRWCRAAEHATTLGSWAPAAWSEPFGVLLGEPCRRCGPGLRRAAVESLRIAVHGTSAPRTPAPEPERPTPPPRAAVRPVERPSNPAVGWTPKMRPRAAVAASARPGRLRCGHPLAARCVCPRVASRREQR